MKRVVKAETDYYDGNVRKAIDECKRLAKIAQEAIWDFQDSASGWPELSEALSNEDIECLDQAGVVFDNYIKNA